MEAWLPTRTSPPGVGSPGRRREGTVVAPTLLRPREPLRLLAELGDVEGRLDDLMRRLRELAEEAQPRRRNRAGRNRARPPGF